MNVQSNVQIEAPNIQDGHLIRKWENIILISGYYTCLLGTVTI